MRKLYLFFGSLFMLLAIVNPPMKIVIAEDMINSAIVSAMPDEAVTDEGSFVEVEIHSLELTLSEENGVIADIEASVARGNSVATLSATLSSNLELKDKAFYLLDPSIDKIDSFEVNVPEGAPSSVLGAGMNLIANKLNGVSGGADAFLGLATPIVHKVISGIPVIELKDLGVQGAVAGVFLDAVEVGDGKLSIGLGQLQWLFGILSGVMFLIGMAIIGTRAVLAKLVVKAV
ncbi:hypothetical protein VCHA53O466_140123 [Vibrio chagasii]|nr:hypothetical protein VCHA53O466_140123 [Vibrio chagasii]